MGGDTTTNSFLAIPRPQWQSFDIHSLKRSVITQNKPLPTPCPGTAFRTGLFKIALDNLVLFLI